MANAFRKAAAKVEPVKASKPVKETSWVVGADDEGRLLAEAVSEVNECHRRAAEFEARADLFKTKLKDYALTKWASHYASLGVGPQTPMKIVNQETGQSVTFVVQDRSANATIKPDQIEALTDILGEGAVTEICFEQTTFGFDAIVMAGPAADGSDNLVQDIVGDGITQMLDALVADGKLTQEQVDGLLTANTTTAYRPGLLPRIANLSQKKVGLFTGAVAAVGSSIVKYIKAG